MIPVNNRYLLSCALATLLVVALCSALPLAAVPAITLYPSGGPDDTAAVHAAIAAVDDGGVIYFSPGTYYVNILIISPTKSFSLVGLGGPDHTLLNGDTTGDGTGDGSVVTIQDTHSLVAPITLEGFTLTNGAHTYGAGLHNNQASTIVTNCVFRDNTASWGGAGMANFQCAPVVTGCIFVDNSASSPGSDGGGMYNAQSQPRISSCRFEGNMALDEGGAIANVSGSSLFVVNTSFVENSAYNGGAIRSHNSVTVTIEYCTISGNRAENDGGGINARNSTMFIKGCTFSENTAENWQGGAIYNREVIATVLSSSFIENEAIKRNAGAVHNEDSTFNAANCVFAGNWAGGEGGVMKNVDDSVVTLMNCTVFGNGAGSNDGALFNQRRSPPTITNCIFWDNGNEIYADDVESIALVTYSDVQGGHIGMGNIDADPLFVFAPTNLSLRAASPCVDAGTNLAPGVLDDILGVPRPQRMAYDMGAYEYAGSSWSPVSLQPLARTQLQAALALWNGVACRIPCDPSDEVTALVWDIQKHMENAAQLTNPVYASGQLAQAAALMEALAALLG